MCAPVLCLIRYNQLRLFCAFLSWGSRGRWAFQELVAGDVPRHSSLISQPGARAFKPEELRCMGMGEFMASLELLKSAGFKRQWFFKPPAQADYDARPASCADHDASTARGRVFIV